MGPVRDEAVARLHALLVRTARFRVWRRASRLQLRSETLDDVATEVADDALVAVLAHLQDFRGASRFTTWACKFAILQTSVALRRRLWKERECLIDEDVAFPATVTSVGVEETVEQLEVFEILRRAVEELLTEHQRAVFVAVSLNGVPIDVVAERFGTTRGAIYKTLHDARQRLRAHLDAGVRAPD